VEGINQVKILILGNKYYSNLKLDDIVDSFDVVYRFNLARPGTNNGTKFGKLVMCSHIYHNWVLNPLSKESMVELYGWEYTDDFVSEYYDFFSKNKEKFDEIYHQNEDIWHQWNYILEDYNSPHRFSKMATSGYSTIFKLLYEVSDEDTIYVAGFTLSEKETRRSVGEEYSFALLKNKEEIENTCHSFSEEKNILAWLHNNKKIDASLCMLEDTEEFTLEDNAHNTVPSQYILDLLNGRIA